MAPVQISVATDADAPALAALAAATFGLACPPTSDPADVAAFVAAHLRAEHFAAHLADPRRTVLHAAVDGRLVGYTMSVSGAPDDDAVAALVTARPAVELSKCYVAAEYHGTGVADALMRATLGHADEAGASTVWLGVNQANRRAQAFYGRHGFTVVGDKTFDLNGSIEHDHVMATGCGAVRAAARW